MDDKEKPIAFFDSGIGGLTVLAKLKKILPNEDYIYFGDIKHIPYGEKTIEQLSRYTGRVFNFFENQGVKAVIMACNTTSATIYEKLKDKYSFKIYPIIQSCASVIAKMPIEKLGVMATTVTIQTGAYAKELKKYNQNLEIFEMPCPPWVRIVEDQTQNMPESIKIVESHLKKMLENKPEKIVLGCTHYPYLLEILSKFAPKEIFIDPAEYFAEYIRDDLTNNNMLNTSSIKGFEEFFVSANPEQFQKASEMFYKVKELPKIIFDED